MRFPTTVFRCLWPLLAALLLTACARDSGTVEVVAIGKPETPFLTAGQLPAAAQMLRAAATEGLVGLSASGQVIPALAESWIVTDDGMSYIFRLRMGKWPDGSAITAEAAQTGLRQAIAGLRGTPMALDLAGIAEIRAMTGRVIELRLDHPQPELLLLLAQPELGVLRKGRGSGAMRLSRDKDAATLTLVEPEKRGQPAIRGWQDRARKLHIRALSTPAALEQFNSGKVNAVVGGGIADLPVIASAGLARGTFQMDPVQGLMGLAVLHNDGFLSLAANRAALAMAIDYDALAAAIGVAGWQPSTHILPAGIEGWAGQEGELWQGADLAARRSAASAQVVKWPGSATGAITLRIGMAEGPGADRIYARLSDDLKQIGLVTTRVGERAAADLRLVEVVARYPRAQWFFNQLHCANQRWACSAEADSLFAEASAAPDPARRAELIVKAEAKLAEANVFIPFGQPLRWSLVRSDTTGFTLNRLGYHPLMSLALRPK